MMDAVSPVSPQSSRSTDEDEKELVNDSGIERVPCDPIHFCRQCGAHWNSAEHSSTSSDHLVGARSIDAQSDVPIQRPSFKRCIIRYRKHRRRHWIALTAIAVLIAIVVALAVHFTRKTAPVGIYRQGAGIVVLDRGDNSTTVDVFFQHESGQIRHAVFNDDQTKEWSYGGPKDNVLGPYAPLPRRGTPLMAVSYTINNETTWRVFYIDSNNLLQESIGSTTKEGEFPSHWTTGSLGLGAFEAHQSLHTGLSACQNMLWAPDTVSFKNGSLVLFYGGADGSNHMLTHEVQDTAWKFNHTFHGSSADSGIECTSRGDEIVDSWMIDTNGHLLQASLNFNPSSNKTVYRPGQWVNGTISDKPVQKPTSVSAIKYTGNSTFIVTNSTFVYFVLSDNIVVGFNVDTSDRSQVPANTTDSCIIDHSPIADGSKIASLVLRTNKPNPKTQAYGEDNKIFLQVASNDTQIIVLSASSTDDPDLYGTDGDGSNIGN